MMNLKKSLAIVAAAFFLQPAAFAFADDLPGMGHLAGNVSGSKPGLLATVMARNVENDVGFMVYVVDDEYRAVNLFPGDYEVTIAPAVGQVFREGFASQTREVRIEAGKQARLDFKLEPEMYEPDYVGGMAYKGGWSDAIRGNVNTPPSPDATVLPYDEVYPPGRGRDILENVCMGCHLIQLFPYNHDRRYASGRPLKDKAGWAITVDRMRKAVAFGRPNKQSYFDEKLLPDEDRDILVDYLADNFGAESEPRVVMLEEEPPLDMEALAKAQFVEYRFANSEEVPKRATHTIGFTVDGYVWVMDRGGALVWLDPRTGEYKDYVGYGGGESILVDKDGTVWYGGLRHFDPKTRKFDEYRFEGPDGGSYIGVSTMIFDENGDQWLSMLGGGGIGKWERKTDKIVWWDVPILRSRPYGITLDRDGKVWFAQYHNSAIARFDPETETFRNYRVTDEDPTNIRRPAVDSNNIAWTATWGSRGNRQAAIYRVEPESGDVTEYRMNIPFANPYDVAPDHNDDIWIATDNYLVRFDQDTETFTNYPLTARTDVPRLSVTAEGAVWHALRNAGHSAGYGGTAVAFYPDKDGITTYAARYADDSVHSALLHWDGEPTKVEGTIKYSPAEPQNPGEYNEMLISHGIEPAEETGVIRRGMQSGGTGEAVE